MTPPRRIIDANPPGRVPAVMLRALAAELSDPGRFSRAKTYARDGAVVDIEIGPGEVRALIRGSRFEPYQTHVRVRPAVAGASALALVPDRDELRAECTCPDDGAFAGALCKHALATLLVLADEVTIDPQVLALWRRADIGGDDPDSRIGDEFDEAGGWRPGGRTIEPEIDVLATSIAARGPIPEVPALPRRLPVAMARKDDGISDLLADVLADALATLRAS